MEAIVNVAAQLGIQPDHLEPYGKYTAKLSEELWDTVASRDNGKLILVTAMNPTPAGEGKTLTTIGLTQGLNRIGRKAIAALREPSLGPCMGMKGGATGSGAAQIVPAEDINLHFTGDIHAVTSAHNLVAAMLDNHIFQGNELQIDTNRILWKRAVDMNDRALRRTVIGLGDGNGSVREDGYMITTASEVMAVLGLAENRADLKLRLGRMIVAYSTADRMITVDDLQATDAMCVLLRHAIKPNLVQTIEGNPVLVHGGPFANIAHGCSSVRATRYGLKLADYVVTEAGFGADLGAEKFMNIKCRQTGLFPSVVVIVATVKALKYNGGVAKDKVTEENRAALRAGFDNLRRHIENVRKFGVPAVVAINRFASDTEGELEDVLEYCRAIGCDAALSEAWAQGGAGTESLAKQVAAVADLSEAAEQFRYLYADDAPLIDKIKTVVQEIYRGGDVRFTPRAARALQRIEAEVGSGVPVCMAKTPYSFSDQPKLLGAPEGFTMEVHDVRLSRGAGFVVVETGAIMTMPGLPKQPAALRMRLEEDGTVVGLM
ncbi:formate--tetrahydrofolate ligase [Paenibacillus taiwanensis]|uniref:formate--tetrahydrofolate ligase n=1 Tax=Paenibacillus taiwanensis TaxID=401638 RepID=UPI00041DF345|nr:formate--tetrahydrofolate ligase [Paenibacillus taiwanensis]